MDKLRIEQELMSVVEGREDSFWESQVLVEPSDEVQDKLLSLAAAVATEDSAVASKAFKDYISDRLVHGGRDLLCMIYEKAMIFARQGDTGYQQLQTSLELYFEDKTISDVIISRFLSKKQPGYLHIHEEDRRLFQELFLRKENRSILFIGLRALQQQWLREPDPNFFTLLLLYEEQEGAKKIVNTEMVKFKSQFYFYFRQEICDDMDSNRIQFTTALSAYFVPNLQFYLIREYELCKATALNSAYYMGIDEGEKKTFMLAYCIARFSPADMRTRISSPIALLVKHHMESIREDFLARTRTRVSYLFSPSLIGAFIEDLRLFLNIPEHRAAIRYYCQELKMGHIVGEPFPDRGLIKRIIEVVCKYSTEDLSSIFKKDDVSLLAFTDVEDDLTFSGEGSRDLGQPTGDEKEIKGLLL